MPNRNRATQQWLACGGHLQRRPERGRRARHCPQKEIDSGTVHADWYDTTGSVLPGHAEACRFSRYGNGETHEDDKN